MIKINLLPQKRAKRASRRRERDGSRSDIVDRRRARSPAPRRSCSSLVDQPKRSQLDDLEGVERRSSQQEINAKNEQLKGYAELKKAADEADERAQSINRLIAAKVVPGERAARARRDPDAGHLPTMTEDDGASKTGNGPESDPNKRFDLDWDPTHVWMTSFIDSATATFKLEGGAQAEADVTQLSKRLAGVGVLRRRRAASRGARRRPRHGHQLLQVHDHRKGGLLMAARWPTSRGMPTQRKVLVFVVIGALLGGLYCQFVFKALKRDLDEAEASTTSKVGAEQEARRATSRSSRSSRRGWTSSSAIIDENQKALPTEAELPAFFETLEPQGASSPASRSTRGSRLPEEPVETFVKVPVEIEITGTFMQIKKFFASLRAEEGAGRRAGRRAATDVEERERIVSIENLALTEPGRAQPRDRLTAKFTASTYRQEEQDARRTRRRRPKRAAPPTPGGSASADAGAGTPQGAKARDRGRDRQG